MRTTKPLIQEYFAYWAALTGDLGVSVTYFPTPVSAVWASRYWTDPRGPTTTFLLGMVLGTVAGWRLAPGWTPHPRHHDPPGRALFRPALLFIYVLSVNLGLFPLRRLDYTLVRRSLPLLPQRALASAGATSCCPPWGGCWGCAT